MAKRSRKKSKSKGWQSLDQVVRPSRANGTATPDKTPALGWRKLDLWPLSRPKGRHYAASAIRLGDTRPFFTVEHPDPATFQKNKPSRLTLNSPEQRDRVSADKTRDYMGCKKRPDGNKRRSAGAGPGKKFVPWCS